eukprot:snap_masked-scaffold_7-processed-gene-17.6-mRNA-1 protein AED:0.35 eAED:0.84 QI:0/0/0/0.5/1/1/2/0/1023
MVLYTVRFKDNTILPQTTKAAKLILSDALKNKVLDLRTQENFITLKRFIELYIKHLNLTCVESTYSSDGTVVENTEKAGEAVQLNKVCREKGRKHLDLLVDSINPEQLPDFSNATKTDYFVLSKDADEFISDHLITFFPEQIDYLTSLTYPYRLNKIIRTLGHSFYLSRDTQLSAIFSTFMNLKWKNEESLMDFNQKFDKALTFCTQHGMFTKTLDQAMIYVSKIKENRTSNNILLSTLTNLDLTSTEKLNTVQSQISSKVYAHDPRGILPHDETLTVNFTNYQTNNQKSSNNFRLPQNTCVLCGENFSSGFNNNYRSCKAKGNTCSCGRRNHLESVCTRFASERRFLQSLKNRKNRTPKTFNNTGKQTQSSNAATYITEDKPLVAPETFVTFLTNKSTSQSYLAEENVKNSQTGGQNLVSCVIDTGSSCNVFNDPCFFTHLNLYKNENTIQVLKNKVMITGVGTVQIKFSDTTRSLTLPAYYIKDAETCLLSNKLLYQLGCNINYDPSHGSIKFANGEHSKLQNINGISKAWIEHSTDPCYTTLDHSPDSIWHYRFMHASTNKLSHLGLFENEKFTSADCETCALTKMRRMPLKTDSLLKTKARKKNQVWHLDLLLPSRHHTGCMLVVADQFTRWIWTSFSLSTKSSDLKHSFYNLLSQAKTSCNLLVLDRQTGFLTTEFLSTLHENKIRFKLATPERHGETKGLAERSILSLRTLARSALKHAKLSTDWWKFAVNYASFIKNRLPHIALENLTPFEVFHGYKPKLQHVKVFGCLAHKIVPTQQRKDKFNDVSIPLIFLGFDPLGSFLTCTLLNKRTKRISHAQLQDIHFVETKFHDSISRAEKLPLIKISKHSMNLYETDSTESSGSDDDSTTEPSHSLNFETSKSSTTPEEINPPEDDEETPPTAPVESSNLDTEGTQQHPIFKQSHSRTGRTLKLPKRFENSINYFVYETSESTKHKIKNRTPRQKEKLKEIILDSKLKQYPRMYKDLANHPQKEEYDKAIQKELQHMHARNHREALRN